MKTKRLLQEKELINGGGPQPILVLISNFIFSNILCSIRCRTLGTILCFFILFYAVVLGVVLGSYPKVFFQFDQTRIDNLGRGLNRVIQDIGNDLGQFVLVMSAWTKTFNVMNTFVQSGNMSIPIQFMNQEFPKILLNLQKVELYGVYFTNGSFAFGRTYDYKTDQLDGINFPREMLTIPFQSFNPLNVGEKRMGFLVSMDRGYPYLIMGMSILDDNNNGPPPGVAIMAQRLDYSYVTEMAQRLQSCVTMYSFNNRSNWQAIDQYNLLNDPNFMNNPIQPSYLDQTWEDVDVRYIWYIFSSINYLPLLQGRSCWPEKNEPLPSQSQTLITDNRIYGLNLYADVAGNASIILRVYTDGRISYLSNYSISVTLIVILILCVILFVTIAVI